MALFGSSHAQRDDALLKVRAELYAVQRRIETLSKDADSIESGIASRDEKIETDFHKMSEDLDLLSREIRHLRKLMKALMRYAQTLIIQLQAKAKKEDFERIQKLVDSWGPERYITRKQFIRLAGTELKKEILSR